MCSENKASLLFIWNVCSQTIYMAYQAIFSSFKKLYRIENVVYCKFHVVQYF